MIKWNNKLKFVLISTITLLFAFIIVSVIIENNIGYFFLYFILLILSFYLPDNNFWNPIKIIISIPALLLFFIKPLLDIIWFMLCGILAPFAITVLFIHYVPEYVFNLDLKFATKTYLIIVISTILITLFSRKIINYINNVVNHDESENNRKITLDLSDKILGNERIRYLIYSFFFIYFLIFSIMKFNEYNYFTHQNTDVAIYYSFSTYLAFERIVNSRQMFSFSPKQVLQKYTEAITSKVDKNQ